MTGGLEVAATARSAVVRTGAVSYGAMRRRDSLAVFGVVTGAYLVGFLWVFGDLAFRSGLGTGLLLVDDPLSHMFRRGPGPLSYEAIALVDLWVVRYLFSPLNLLLGVALATLTGVNLALSYLAITQPKSCGMSASTGMFASIPALLAGSACCAPVVFLVLGIQASAVLLTAFAWLLPVGVLMLVGSLVYLAGKVDLVALAR